MLMFDAFGDGEHDAGFQLDGILSPNLNVTRARFRDENLTAAVVFVPESVCAVNERDITDAD